MFNFKRVAIILIVISLIFFVRFLVNNKQIKSGSKYQSLGNTLIESIDIHDIKDLDKYPDVKKFLQENQYYEKLQNVISENQAGNNNNGDKKTLSKEVEAKIQKKYGLVKPALRSSSRKITIIIQRNMDQKIAEASFEGGLE